MTFIRKIKKRIVNSSKIRYHFNVSQAIVVEWQTRYFEGVVSACSCEFKSHRSHHYDIDTVITVFFLCQFHKLVNFSLALNNSIQLIHHTALKHPTFDKMIVSQGKIKLFTLPRCLTTPKHYCHHKETCCYFCYHKSHL